MLKIFTGDNRVQAKAEITRILGPDYEVIDGLSLTPDDLPSIFMGGTLFASTRNILIRDLSENKPVFEKIPDYLDTPNNVIILELKLDKRSTTYKAIKDKITIQEFTMPKNPNMRLVFDIYKIAKTDGKKAVQTLSSLKTEEDPIMFFGLIVSQAIKDYSQRQGIKEKTILKELAKVDLQMKSTQIDPWLLVESFLLRLSTITKK
ncbi:hypothetical protein IKD49_00825 [Candidatus Saccharibacteria bacterium]|nr:hypothetical protein [Candidatus Saccharibacteria bacterium]